MCDNVPRSNLSSPRGLGSQLLSPSAFHSAYATSNMTSTSRAQRARRLSLTSLSSSSKEFSLVKPALLFKGGSEVWRLDIERERKRALFGVNGPFRASTCASSSRARSYARRAARVGQISELRAQTYG